MLFFVSRSGKLRTLVLHISMGGKGKPIDWLDASWCLKRKTSHFKLIWQNKQNVLSQCCPALPSGIDCQSNASNPWFSLSPTYQTMCHQATNICLVPNIDADDSGIKCESWKQFVQIKPSSAWQAIKQGSSRKGFTYSSSWEARKMYWSYGTPRISFLCIYWFDSMEFNG